MHMQRKGVTDICALGFCWGLGPVLELALEGKVKCGASVHPSMMVLGMASDRTAEEFKKIKVPLWLGPAKDDDPSIFPDGAFVKAVNAGGGKCESVLFEDQYHGFFSRAPLRDDATPLGNWPVTAEASTKACEKCMECLTEFLEAHLGDPDPEDEEAEQYRMKMMAISGVKRRA